MKITKNTDYGLMFLKELSGSFKKGVYLSTSKIAQKYDISEDYLKKIANQLKTKRLIKAKEGKGGGYILAKDPSKITLDRVMDILEGELMVSPCQYCPKATGSCGFNSFWEEVGMDWQKYFKNIKLSDL